MCTCVYCWDLTRQLGKKPSTHKIQANKQQKRKKKKRKKSNCRNSLCRKETFKKKSFTNILREMAKDIVFMEQK